MPEMSLEDKRSLIGIRLQMLIDVFGKRVTDEGLEALKRVYGDALEKLPASTISQGFTRAEQECERFPTPKLLKDICSQFMPSSAWKYDYKPGKDANGIACLIDPTETGPIRFMYRPQDCAEGRAFLANLRKVANKPPDTL